MSAYDLSANQGASLALGGTGVLSTSISGSAAYCRPLTRSTSSASTVSQGSTDLQLGKLDVSLHQLKTSRSGQSLLASELKRSARRALHAACACITAVEYRLSNLPVTFAGPLQFLPKVQKAFSEAKSAPAQRSSALQPSLLLTRHLVILKLHWTPVPQSFSSRLQPARPLPTPPL